MFRYCASGLSVESELRLPGFRSRDVPDSAPDSADVTIRRSAVPYTIEAPHGTGPTWAFDDTNFLLRIPNVGRFLVSGGRTILFDTEGRTEVEDLAAFIEGSVFGILQHQRGRLVLSASAISVNGCAVLFCGPSGVGKSTLAALMGAAGFPFLADDLCTIDLDGEVPKLLPDGPHLKLWTKSIEGLALGDRRTESVRRGFEKYYVTPEQAANGPQPIGAVYLLREARPPGEAGVLVPDAIDRVRLLLRHSYRARLIEPFGQQTVQFRAASRLASQVHTLRRSMRFSSNGQTIDWLESHWRDLGLLESAQ